MSRRREVADVEEAHATQPCGKGGGHGAAIRCVYARDKQLAGDGECGRQLQ